MRTLFIAFVFLVAGCGGDTVVPETSGNDLDPVATTQQWLDAVSAGDAAALSELVEPTGLAVIAAVENNLRSDELAALLRDGLSPDLNAQYWSDFASSFAVFSGFEIDELVVGQQAPVAGAVDAVQVSVAAGGVNQPVILRNTEGGWQIDYAATIGPAVAEPLGEYLESALGGDYGAEIATAYRDAVVPGLDLALLVQPNNNALVFEAEYIRQLSAG